MLPELREDLGIHKFENQSTAINETIVGQSYWLFISESNNIGL